jgi:exodeoxyribonuclease VII small subunit
MTFEEDVGRLEVIVRDLERDDLELDRALQLFEEGIARLRNASSALAVANGRVEELVEAADGTFALEPRDD